MVTQGLEMRLPKVIARREMNHDELV